jgi:hypothetical protein
MKETNLHYLKFIYDINIYYVFMELIKKLLRMKFFQLFIHCLPSI